MLRDALATATRIAHDAGRLALSLQGRGVEVEEKHPRDLVSEADRAVEARIVEALHDAFPDDVVIGEEGAGPDVGDAPAGRRRWYVDPIDGTTNYLKGLPQWGVSLGLADGDDELLLGVVVLPVTDEVFGAVRGGGATRNGVPIRCADVTRLDRTVIGYALSPRSGVEWGDGLHRSVRRLQQQALGTRMQGCAVADLTAVAMGRIDATVLGGLHAWDVAAGLVIAREAGARITTPDGADTAAVATAGVVSPPAVHDAIRAVLLDRD